MEGRPPPPPPPHGSHQKASGLPAGNYDIFIIPPHSSGSGFLYLPSLAPHRNSFIAGVACTLAVVGLWAVVIPAIRQWTSSLVQSGGMSIFVLVFGVGVIGWAYGKTQLENQPSAGGAQNPGAGGDPRGTGFNASSSSSSHHFGAGGTFSAGTGTTPRPTWSKPSPGAASWEKAREETRKKEQERRQKEEAAKKAKEAVDKDRLEKQKARDRETREKEIREKVAQERLRREQEREREAKSREKEQGKASNLSSGAREDLEAKARQADAAAAANSAGRRYQKATAQSATGDDEYSYRPYDDPKDSQSSIFSQSSIPSQSTAPSTAPPKGPTGSRVSYRTKDPDKIVIKAVYMFTDASPKPAAQLLAGTGTVTDGLVLRMTTEGMFIDDDVRGVGQREWDVKAWTMKLVENGDFKGRHVLRASVRDAEGKKYVFIIPSEEAWKVAVGLQRLRRGTQVRALGVSGLQPNDTRNILGSLGWV